ncbi:MAG: hypothetical protein K6T86_06040 [Pirellulales bacterium]|nr:hypothetical protein [Pirellulales bacterium]
MYKPESGQLMYVRRFRTAARMVGILYLAVGIPLCMGVWLGPTGSMSTRAQALALAAGLLCTALGALLAWGRTARVIDISAGVAVCSWGLGIPMLRRTWPLAEVSSVAAVVKDGARRFAICLVDATGGAWELLSCPDASGARQISAEVAGFLGRPWYDHTQLPAAMPEPAAEREPEVEGAPAASTGPGATTAPGTEPVPGTERLSGTEPVPGTAPIAAVGNVPEPAPALEPSLPETSNVDHPASPSSPPTEPHQ